MAVVGLLVLFWVWMFAGYFHFVAFAESIPSGSTRAEVDAHMFGFWAGKVDDIDVEPCGHCGRMLAGHATPYRYRSYLCPMLKCYVWFDENDRLVLMAPDYE